MIWSEQQRAAVTEEYRRVGYVQGEQWPTPPAHLSPDELLAILRTVPDGAGRAGYAEALARRAAE